VYLYGNSYDEWFLETKAGKPIQIGVVAFERCHFRRCVFHSITFAGSPTYLQGIKRHFQVWRTLGDDEQTRSEAPE